ncbi:MAG: methylamine dehydrogenase light chain [Pseudomonadota bacterium]
MTNWIDKAFEKSATELADRTSRRGFLGALGVILVGGALAPLLPVLRISDARAAGGEAGAPEGDWKDPNACAYWAHCSVHGYMCSCCGGSTTQCPPGTQLSPIAWVGTCKNPGDDKTYVVKYNDCCGASECKRCFCNRSEGDTPKYQVQKSNAITWCYGGVAPSYHCTIARIEGVDA